MYQSTTRGKLRDTGRLFLITAAILVFFKMATVAQTVTGAGLPYIPLRTNRNEILKRETVLAVKPNRIEFVVADASVVAEFSLTECDPNGWKVPPRTLVSLQIVPKKRTVPDELTFQPSVLIAIDGTRYYFEKDVGTEYQYRRDENGWYLDTIRRVPKSSDSALRCKGFPEYDPLSEHYVAYDRGIIQSVSKWDVARVFTTSEAARQNQLRAFIFVYCPSKNRKLGDLIIRKMNAFLRRSYGEVPENLRISYGGARSECQFESFLIRTDQPEVRPRPTQSP